MTSHGLDAKRWRGISAGRARTTFPRKALARGTRVEMEHTSDRAVAERIAMDHLTEDPWYYTKLAKMEATANRVGGTRARSAGFVVLDIHSGEVQSPLFKRRDEARAAIAAYYGFERLTVAQIQARGLRVLGVHAVKLRPGETFDPTERR